MGIIAEPGLTLLQTVPVTCDPNRLDFYVVERLGTRTVQAFRVLSFGLLSSRPKGSRKYC